MTRFTTEPLSEGTWPAFARLVDKHHGIFGGCWCMFFHLETRWAQRSAAMNRAAKEQRVREGRAHAALVFDGPLAIGFCQFGPTAELPRIKNRKTYEAGQTERPDWRITCFFVDRERRGEGVARFALRQALAEIGRLGGGLVEAYPDEVSGRRVPGAFLWAGTVPMFERAGFERARQIGKNNWVVRRTVRLPRAPQPARGSPPARAPPTKARPLGGAANAIIK